MSRYEYVDIHLSSDRVQGVQVSRWNTLVTMNNAYSYGRVGHRQGEGGGDRLVERSFVRTILETGATHAPHRNLHGRRARQPRRSSDSRTFHGRKHCQCKGFAGFFLEREVS